jgi:hypothetical protein
MNKGSAFPKMEAETVVVDHSPYQLRDSLRWVANFELEFHGNSITSQQCLEPREDLTFATREEAIERNRLLAHNWRDANAPGLKLFERDVTVAK